MRRLTALTLLVCLTFASAIAPARAQFVVTDPLLEKLATQQWIQDLKNAVQFVNIAQSGASQLVQSIQQTQYQLKNATTLSAAQVAFRNANAEWTSLQNLVKVENGVIAATGHASTDIQKAFPGATTANQASAMAAQANSNLKGTILSAAQGVDVRLNQMQSEESLLASLRSQVQNAQNSNLGTNQLLQIGLQLASEQLDELRSLERMMLIQFQAQQAYMYAHGSSETQQILGQSTVESFFSPRAAQ